MAQPDEPFGFHPSAPIQLIRFFICIFTSIDIDFQIDTAPIKLNKNNVEKEGVTYANGKEKLPKLH